MRTDVLQPTLEAGIPLQEVTFCVVDLETTGGSPTESAITEVGAVKYRGGERLGSFQSLVDPRRPIPRAITHLTGIDDLAVAGAPPIEGVLPAFLAFVEGCVFVAHNARFDFGFVNAGLIALDYDPLPPPPVCTARLARRVVWPDVPNVRLATLAQYFRTAARPNHRALADAEACAEVLHGLLDLGGRLGILTLGDLHEAVRSRGRPNFGKIRLADHLPSRPGVYLFRNRRDEVLYVGKARDLRQRVKQYFYGDDRKRIADMLDGAAAVEGRPCDTELEALVIEARLIRQHEPPFNRRGKTWRRYAYLKLDLDEAWPRLKVVRKPTGRGPILGPFHTAAAARLAKEAVEGVFPIRRCTRSMGRGTRFAPCALADIGRCLAPCDGRTGPERYEELVGELASSLSAPDGLLEALEARMADLAAAERYEEAAVQRDRVRALAEALIRARLDRWLTAGRIVLRDRRTGARVHLAGGTIAGDPGAGPIGWPCPRDRADELAAVRSWVQREPLVIEAADVPPAEPVRGGRALAEALRRLRGARRPPPEDDGLDPAVRPRGRARVGAFGRG